MTERFLAPNQHPNEPLTTWYIQTPDQQWWSCQDTRAHGAVGQLVNRLPHYGGSDAPTLLVTQDVTLLDGGEPIDLSSYVPTEVN